MLAYILALLVGLGSFGLYMAAFFLPEVHRKNDFIWSGVGLFYALVLWVCAGRMTGGVLLGQLAVVSLLGWFAWQTLLLRRAIVPANQQTPLPTVADIKVAVSNLSSSEGRSQITRQASRTLGQLKEGVQEGFAAAKQAKAEMTADTYVPPRVEEFGTAGQEAIERFAKVAIPSEIPVDEVAQGVQDAVDGAIADLPQAQSAPPDALTTAAEVASRAIASAQPPSVKTEPSSNWVNTLSAFIQSLFKGSSPAPVPPATAPKMTSTIDVAAAPSQPDGLNQPRDSGGVPPVDPPPSQPYVRKKYRETASPAQSSDAPASQSTNQPYVRKKYRQETEPTPTEPSTYVRKKFRQETTDTSDSKPVYVRKKYRQEDPDGRTANQTPADVMDATVISVSEEINRTADGSLVAEAVIEIESESLAPDLLASAMIVSSTSDPAATVEDIVEELLEDISVQEEAVKGESVGEEGVGS